MSEKIACLVMDSPFKTTNILTRVSFFIIFFNAFWDLVFIPMDLCNSVFLCSTQWSKLYYKTLNKKYIPGS